MSIFGERLRKLREEKDIKQAELAKMLALANSTVSQYESSKLERIPDAEILLKLADILDCSVDYLLGRTNVRTPFETIAAHHEGEEWTEEELEDIEEFKRFVRMRREQKKNQ